jgi:transposase, IS30 family
MKFKHLTVEDREKIQEMLWQKASIRKIAKVLERNPSSVYREIKRNSPELGNVYAPRMANLRALEKRKSRGRKLRLKSGFIRRYVMAGLKTGLSPEQIGGRLKLEYSNESISHEAIYQFIYAQVNKEGRGLMKKWRHDLRPYLKRRHKYRRKQGLRKGERVFRLKGLCIDERPKEVETRVSLGHWETDSMISRKSSVGLNTLVERKTGLVFISKIKNATAKQTKEVIIQRLSVLPKEIRKTITSDNGSENALYDEVQESLDILWYFAHPYHSWERGTNENTNGLIRWYFPKGTDFGKIRDETIQAVENALNNRPRKRLGWRNPLEAFNESVAITG